MKFTASFVNAIYVFPDMKITLTRFEIVDYHTSNLF